MRVPKKTQKQRKPRARAAGWASLKVHDIPSSTTLFPVLFRYISPNSRILDVGCGPGKVSSSLYEQGYANIFGIDINPNAVRFARKSLSKLGMQKAGECFRVANAQKIPFPNSSFDCIINKAFWTTVTSNRAAIIKEIARVLKPQGVLYLAEFAQNWRAQKFRQDYEKGIRKGYEKGTFDAASRSGMPDLQVHHYTKAEFASLLKQAGFRIEHYSKEPFKTRTGTPTIGHVIIAGKSA